MQNISRNIVQTGMKTNFNSNIFHKTTLFGRYLRIYQISSFSPEAHGLSHYLYVITTWGQNHNCSFSVNMGSPRPANCPVFSAPWGVCVVFYVLDKAATVGGRTSSYIPLPLPPRKSPGWNYRGQGETG